MGVVSGCFLGCLGCLAVFSWVVGCECVSIVGLGAAPRGISCAEARFMLRKLRCLACVFCVFLSLIPISYLFLTRADSPGGASPIKTYERVRDTVLRVCTDLVDASV